MRSVAYYKRIWHTGGTSRSTLCPSSSKHTTEWQIESGGAKIQLEIFSHVEPVTLLQACLVYPDIGRLFEEYQHSLTRDIIARQFPLLSAIFSLRGCEWLTAPRSLFPQMSTRTYLTALNQLNNATRLYADFLTDCFSTLGDPFSDDRDEIMDFWITLHAFFRGRKCDQDWDNHMGWIGFERRIRVAEFINSFANMMKRKHPIICRHVLPVPTRALQPKTGSYRRNLPDLAFGNLEQVLIVFRREHSQKDAKITKHMVTNEFNFGNLWTKSVYFPHHEREGRRSASFVFLNPETYFFRMHHRTGMTLHTLQFRNSQHMAQLHRKYDMLKVFDIDVQLAGLMTF
ncbi:hypothetical protein K432DRAFT_472431 [Lepidopterella palustris CBS 459.81]|uniref:Uncharacterized protein n=1 Tax=Lepidopterella palustris CBS 459.81 TaxID=1314670 RepID=A0A8E2EEM9_9PEZI|nr:hypothetical protein K432DRAFT_472431 [Lepidopterella palustris CBS 459.81]